MKAGSQKILIRATCGFVILGLAALAHVFTQTLAPTEAANANRPYFEVALDDIAEGEAQLFEWRGKPFYILRRTPEQIHSLELVRPYLRDPDSLQLAVADKSMNTPWRSPTPEIFVASVLTSHSQCGVRFRPEKNAVEWAAPWHGGFFEECRGAAYDLAGRVYAAGAKDAKNLLVIPHAIVGARVRVYADAF